MKKLYSAPKFIQVVSQQDMIQILDRLLMEDKIDIDVYEKLTDGILKNYDANSEFSLEITLPEIIVESDAVDDRAS